MTAQMPPDRRQPADYVATLGSLFAGVGGFDLGFEQAGFRTLWQAEIDPWCQKVLARHWPEATQHGDVTQIHGGQLAPVDVITFGSPCQDMSVAGNRAGLDGVKSVLFYEATRIIGQMREATDGRCPTWALWENVPGALSSDSGNDFASVLDALAAVGAVEIEWRVLDARFLGVPQRRRRLFLLAGFHPRAGSAAPVLFEPEGRHWRPAAGHAAGEDIAGTLGAGSAGGGWADDTDRMNGETDTLLPIGFQSTDGLDFQYCPGYSPTIKVGSGIGIASPPSVAYSIRSDAMREGVAKTPSADAEGNVRLRDPGMGVYEGIAPTVDTGQAHAVAYRKAQKAHDSDDCERWEETQITDTLTERDGTATASAIVSDMAVRRLTPRECERLMGWPDDHTRWTADGKEISDSHRYRMCGNGVVAPVAEWIARRLLAELHIDGADT